tara:strand:+ start:1236 stop:1688 length:453 start_codon:yes stop_codon:yes gene_type:complete
MVKKIAIFSALAFFGFVAFKAKKYLEVIKDLTYSVRDIGSVNVVSGNLVFWLKVKIGNTSSSKIFGQLESVYLLDGSQILATGVLSNTDINIPPYGSQEVKVDFKIPLLQAGKILLSDTDFITPDKQIQVNASLFGAKLTELIKLQEIWD